MRSWWANKLTTRSILFSFSMYQIVSLYISFYQSRECPDPFIVVSPWLTVSITGQQMFAKTLWRSKPLFLRPFLIRHQDHTNAILNHQISTPAQRSPHYYSPRPCCSESSDKDTWNRWNSVDLIWSRLARSSPCLWTWRFFVLHPRMNSYCAKNTLTTFFGWSQWSL